MSKSTPLVKCSVQSRIKAYLPFGSYIGINRGCTATHEGYTKCNCVIRYYVDNCHSECGTICKNQAVYQSLHYEHNEVIHAFFANISQTQWCDAADL